MLLYHLCLDHFSSAAFGSLIEGLKLFYSPSKLFAFSSGPVLNVAEYIDLALIISRNIPKNNKEIKQIVAKTLHGTIDDIDKPKKRIELKDIFNDGKKRKFRKVLVEGAPGIGKTVLASYLCSEWAAGRLLQQYECVLLIHLRHFQDKVYTTMLPGQKQERDFSISDLIKVYKDGDIGLKASEWLNSKHGEGTLIILEGWDELPQELRLTSSIFSQIISGQKLPACSVLVTSRPWCSDELYNFVERRIEILGFTTDETIKMYIEKNASDQKEHIMTYLKNHPNIKRFAYVPQTLSIICMIVQNAEELPLTLTELYKLYILSKIHFSLKRNVENRLQRIPPPKSFEDLPRELQRMLCALSKLAFDGFMEKRFVFRAEDLSKLDIKINDRFDGYGLLNSFPCYAGSAYDSYLQFQHLTVQEYMAAYHFLHLELDIQIDLLMKFRENLREYDVMCKFISGISRLENVELRKAIIEKTKEFSNEDQLFLLHCAFEACNVDVYDHASVYLNRWLEFSNKHLTPTDCLSVAYIVGQIGGEWFLRLRGCNLEGKGLEILRYHLEELQSQNKARSLVIRAIE